MLRQTPRYEHLFPKGVYPRTNVPTPTEHLYPNTCTPNTRTPYVCSQNTCTQNTCSFSPSASLVRRA